MIILSREEQIQVAGQLASAIVSTQNFAENQLNPSESYISAIEIFHELLDQLNEESLIRESRQSRAAVA